MNISYNDYRIMRSAWIKDVSKEVAIDTEKHFANWIADHRSDGYRYTISASDFGDEW